MTRFPIRYTFGKGLVLRLVGAPKRWAYVAVDERRVRVRMSWAFRAKFDRGLVEAAEPAPKVRVTAGAHGWRGRWLVNGASAPLVAIRLKEPARAWVAGFPVRLREVVVSVADPDALIAALS
jgi:hypothetical protein